MRCSESGPRVLVPTHPRRDRAGVFISLALGCGLRCVVKGSYGTASIAGSSQTWQKVALRGPRTRPVLVAHDVDEHQKRYFVRSGLGEQGGCKLRLRTMRVYFLVF